jgi:DNA polymerase-3 subunit beta
MRIAASAGRLADALALAALALDNRVKVAILHAVHIRAADGVARLTVNSMDRAITVTVQAEAVEPGDAAIRAAALAGMAAGFPKDSAIEIEASGHRAQVRCAQAAYRLPVMPIEDLPEVAAIDVVTGEAELAREDLLAAIKQVTFAAATEATRFYLNGILLHDEGSQLAAVATDARRLAKCRIPSAPFSQDLTCIVPLATIDPIVKLLGKSKAERVKLRRSKSLVEITAPEFAITSPLIDAVFPDYRRVIPAAPDNGATVDRADLVAALARLAAVATTERKIATLAGLEWSPAEPALRLSLPNETGVAADIIPATIAGSAPVRTAAQLAHVTELAKELHGESVCIASNGNDNHILVTDPDSDAVLVVQMPCAVPGQSSQAA